MNPSRILLGAIAFMIAGIAFCSVAFYLKRPESVKKAPLSATAGTIFYIIGALTFITGLMALLFRNEVSKTVIEVFFLIYLIALTVIFFVFYSMMNTKKPNKDSEN